RMARPPIRRRGTDDASAACNSLTASATMSASGAAVSQHICDNVARMSARFTDRVLVVSGGGHGIGRATAQRIGAEGARVAALDLRGNAAEETVTELKRERIEARAYQEDCADWVDVEATIERIREDFGRVDILHSNAGVVLPGSLEDQSLETWDRTFQVNVRAMFLLARAVLPLMLAQGKGAIVNTASTSGLVGEPSLLAYCSSKAAVISLTRQMAIDYSS